MSKKIFFIVLTCCLLVATFCVSFAGAPQVQSVPADIRAVLDRPDCAAAPLIVPPVVEPLSDYVISTDDTGFDLPYVADLYDGDLSYVPAGMYLLAPNFDLSSSYTISISPVDFGSVTLLGIDLFDGDVLSSVSFFTLLYSEYEGFSVIVDDYGNATLEFTPISGGSYSVSGSHFALYLRFNGAFSLYSEVSSSFSFYSLSVASEPIMTDLVDIFVSGLRALGTNVGRAFSTMANAIFINTDGTGLSTFGILVVVFAAVSLGLSLTRWVLNFCSSWGKRNR